MQHSIAMLGENNLKGTSLFAILALASSASIKDFERAEARDIVQDNAFTQMLPQYLNWFSSAPAQTLKSEAGKPAAVEHIKPIIIVQGERPSASYYGYDGNNYWPYYTPTPPPPAQHQQHYAPPPEFVLQPQRLPEPPRKQHINGLSNFGGSGSADGGFPAYIIINPMSLQSLAGPPQPPVKANAPRTASSTSIQSHDSTPVELASITNLLGNAAAAAVGAAGGAGSGAAEEDADTVMALDAKPALSDLSKAFTDNLDLSSLDLTPEELEALRKNARTLTPKRLVALLTQDNRRQRVEEAMAGIYLRNFNLNKK